MNSTPSAFPPSGFVAGIRIPSRYGHPEARPLVVVVLPWLAVAVRHRLPPRRPPSVRRPLPSTPLPLLPSHRLAPPPSRRLCAAASAAGCRRRQRVRARRRHRRGRSAGLEPSQAGSPPPVRSTPGVIWAVGPVDRRWTTRVVPVHGGPPPLEPLPCGACVPAPLFPLSRAAD
uniref:Uncharacterized protein n=1 Tax=Oryza sativa subsp. japonica TaxID=39947 RepID=Q6K2N4_ORYSJ|nr:hypothetical protein [Oryza sativa Japonica Group]